MRWQILSTFAIMAFFSFLSAANAQSCSPYLTIFRLSNETNAHVSNYNYDNYPVSVCLDDLFIIPTNVISQLTLEQEMGIAPGTLRSRSEDGKNVLFRKYYENNSHASVPGFNQYPINVSFGDLDCVVEPGTEVCDNSDPQRKLVAVLKYANNSHLSMYNPNYAATDFQVCCKSTNLVSVPDSTCTIDGNIDTMEECDGNNFRAGDSCALRTSGTLTGGNLTCTQACRVSTDSCFDVGEQSQFCRDYGINGSVFRIEIEGEFVNEPVCSDINNIEGSDVPPAYILAGGNLTDYKKQMCEDCSILTPRSRLGDYLPLDGYNPVCMWNYTNSSCYLSYQSLNNQVCTIRVVADAECEPGQAVKTITITDSCDPNCSPQNSSGANGCQRQVTCPRVVQLPFFDLKNFLASIILIGVAYFAYHKIKK